MREADLSDSELVAQAAEPGPARQAAELALYQRYAGRARRYAERHMRDAAAAADMTQLVMLSVIDAIRGRRIKEPERLGAFVLSTCRHLVWDENRAAERARRLHESLRVEQPSAAEPSTTAVDRLKLEDCVRKLPAREQSVVLLTYCEEWPSDRIASEVGTTSGNVRVLRHRALGRLLECLEKDAEAAER